MSEEDKRRKLSEIDYIRIRQYALKGYTVRAIANECGISTKYVRKILVGNAPAVSDLTGSDSPITFSEATFACSGCGRIWTTETDLSQHIAVWTSGGTHELDCWQVAPAHPKLLGLR